jgi:hypothetical protein
MNVLQEMNDYLGTRINNTMPRTGIRPHTWKVQGEVPHQQNIAWLRAQAQARFRNEVWLLDFDDFQRLWAGLWQFRGRGSEDYVMTRDDHQGAWVLGNVSVTRRYEYLKRQREYRGY